MTRSIDRRLFLTSGAASILGSCAFAEAPLTSLRPRAREEDFLRQIQPDPSDLVEKAGLGGKVGFAVLDMRSETPLETMNAALALPPASVAKVMTAAYALDVLGPEHRFGTTLIATGSVSNGRLNGDLALVGGGDPTLDTNALAELAKQLKSAGIREVTGDYLVWDHALPSIRSIDENQPLHVGYSPAVSGLNLNFNRVHFNWTRTGNGYAVSMEAPSSAYRPSVRMAQMAVETRSLPVYTYQDQNGRDEWTVARSALGKGGARWLPVRKPGLYAAEVFQSLAKAQGIALKTPKFLKAEPTGSVVARLQSQPLRLILKDMLEYSTNLTAEVVGLMATAQRAGQRPGTLLQSAKAMSRWASEKYQLSSMQFVDHSGLGDKSRISPQDMAKALFQMRKSTELRSLLKPFPMRDAQRRVIKNHPISVLAKTGTLNFVSGLAGFVDLPDGRELVFAFFSANLDLREALTVEQREKPPGGREWNRRSKTLQQSLIERWGAVYAL